MKFQILATLIILGIAGRGEAGFNTGSQILSNCESNNETEQSLCALYLEGIADATELWIGAGVMPKLICMPGDASTEKLQEVFLEYANENPGELDEVASSDLDVGSDAVAVALRAPQSDLNPVVFGGRLVSQERRLAT